MRVKLCSTVRGVLIAAVLGAGAAAGSQPLAPSRAASLATLQIVGPWELGSLDPARSGYLFTRTQVTETLVSTDDDAQLQPGLASGWTTSKDGLIWRFDLRSTARFHDGSPFSAEAVVKNLERARTPPAMLSAAPVKRIAADGPRALVIELARPFVALPALLAHSSTQILAPASFAADGNVQSIVGTGPYRITRVQPPQQFEAEAFAGYDGAQPDIKAVRYLSAGRAETRALMAESAQADLVYGIDPASLQRLRRSNKLSILSVTLPRTIIVKVNASHPALRDLRVRQALSLSIDRQGIARAILRDPAMAATQLFPPTLRAWHDAALVPLEHDAAQAERLLAAAGWRRQDGKRDAPLLGPDAKPLQLQLRTFPDRPELPIVATALQEQWRQAGIAVRVSVGNSGEIPLGHRDGTLELALAARNYADVPDPQATLWRDFGPTGGDWGAMNWRSDKLERALVSLSQGSDAAHAAALRKDVATVIQAELPVLPVAWYRQQVAVSPRVQGVTLDPLESSFRITSMRWSHGR